MVDDVPLPVTLDDLLVDPLDVAVEAAVAFVPVGLVDVLWPDYEAACELDAASSAVLSALSSLVTALMSDVTVAWAEDA